MRHQVIEALVQRSLNGPYAIRQILKGGHPHNRKQFQQQRQPKFIKGIYKGQYFRVKLPQKEAAFPKLPSFPTILPVPISVSGVVRGSPKLSLESLFPLAGRDESLFRRFLIWWRVNWPTMLLNCASICTLLAFTRSDVVELRSLSAMGSIGNAIYRYTQKPVLWITIAWPSLFASVNGWKIIDILHERNAEVHMDEQHESIYVEHFLQHGITPKQFQRIAKAAEVVEFEKGETLMRKGAKLNHMYLVIDGSTQAHIMGRHLTAQSSSAGARFKPGGDSGAWVGEMTFLDQLGEKERLKTAPTKSEKKQTDENSVGSSAYDVSKGSVEDEGTGMEGTPKTVEAPSPTNASKSAHVLYTVLAKEKCVVWRWSFEDMEMLMSSSADLGGAMTRAMTSSIVGKVVNMTISRTNEMPHWSMWLSDWVRDDDAKVEVQSMQELPEERKETEAMVAKEEIEGILQ